MIVSRPMPGPGERRDDRAADPARADHRDLRRLELALPDPADLRQDDVPRVALELVVGEGHWPGGAEAPGSAARSRRAPRPREMRALLHRRRHQLRDALAALDLERLAAEIGEDDLHLAAIIAGRSCPAC